ncbi:MAG TPA: GntR family transcriptional regulator [Solirubrobacteraceae bacterium]|jgi:DNA-binding GntR family transcriptional regulator
MLVTTTTAERAASELRERIASGELRPGQRLAEERLARVLQVSRNTLRESFRLLAHDGLVDHVVNRGVFVRQLAEHDVRDLYRLRRMVECSALREFARRTRGVGAAQRAALLADLDGAVRSGERAAEEGRWAEIPTADLEFHRCLTALAGSARADELMGRAMAELRLVFWVMAGSREFHEPYLRRNRALVGMLTDGDVDGAEQELIDYLDEAETDLLRIYGMIQRYGEPSTRTR